VLFREPIYNGSLVLHSRQAAERWTLGRIIQKTPSEDDMKRLIDRINTLGIVASLFFYVCACTGNMAPSASASVVDLSTRLPNWKSPTIGQFATTPTQSPTSTISPTLSENPTDYKLINWREPTEVITDLNMKRLELVGQLLFPDSLVHAVWSADGSTMGILAGNGVYILDPVSFTTIRLIDEKYPLEGFPIALSPDGKTLASGGHRFDVTTGKELTVNGGFHPYPGGAWMDAEFSADGKYYLLCGDAFCLKLVMQDDVPIISFGRQDILMDHVSISKDSKYFALNYDFVDYTEIWNALTVKPIFSLQLKGMKGQGKPRFSSVGKSLFLTAKGTWNNADASFLQEWDYTTGRILDVQLLPAMGEDAVEYSMDISPISGIIAFGGLNGEIYLLRPRDCHALQVGTSKNFSFNHETVFRPDGKLFATIEEDNGGVIDLWGIPSVSSAQSPITPTVTITETIATCPKVPIIQESTIPHKGWVSG
jgi:hypothetical protein